MPSGRTVQALVVLVELAADAAIAAAAMQATNVWRRRGMFLTLKWPARLIPGLFLAQEQTIGSNYFSAVNNDMPVGF